MFLIFCFDKIGEVLLVIVGVEDGLGVVANVLKSGVADSVKSSEPVPRSKFVSPTVVACVNSQCLPE